MFDAETAQLIRAAPGLREVDPALLPQELTRVYAELAGLRLRGVDPAADPEFRERLERLMKLATIYEAAVDTGATGTARRAAAFVAGTAHQILGRALRGVQPAGADLLTLAAIHSDVAAPLLFLIAEQNPDAREAARPLAGTQSEDLLRTALLETIHDLAEEHFERILERADRLAGLNPATEADLSLRAAQALYGLCWSGVVHMVARLLDRPVPQTAFIEFDTPEASFDNVVALATEDIVLPGEGGHLVSTYGGPRHLARLLRHVATGLEGAGLAGLPAPPGADGSFWRQWLRHRAQSKPVLWPNYRAAVATGFLEPGRSSVVVLPTGAGKTTLSELKIAATLAQGRKVIFLVPTLALVDQLHGDLLSSFPAGLGDVGVSADGDLTALVAGPELKSIEVMTPERCLALLSFADADVADVGLIVFDECHLLSEHGGGARSVDAMLCLLHVLKRAPDADLLLLSAMLTNGDEVAAWLQDVRGRPCSAFYYPWKPSRQARGVVVYPLAQVAAADAAARAKQRAKRLHQRYHPPPLPATPHALFGLQNNWNPDVAEDVRLVRLADAPVPLALGLGRATPNANTVAAALAAASVNAGLKAIVFVQQANHAPATAVRLQGVLPGVERLTPTEQGLWTDIQAELGAAAHSLLDPAAGALPHNGDMIPLERRLAESLFRRVDGIGVIVATPTLAQGMNLPAQIAILAGNMRHSDAGRAELQRHEILNAAGRAGRAGYLANGTVLLIPEPVVSFDDDQQPSNEALGKLQSLLPPNDQCVRIDDPLTNLLDRIQAGEADQPSVRYLLSRLRAGEEDDKAQEVAIAMMSQSFAAYQAKASGNGVAFREKITALQSALEDYAGAADAHAMRVGAFTGMPSEPLEAAMARMNRNLAALPSTIVGWSDWLIDFFCEDIAAFNALFGDDSGVVALVARGVKKGGPPTPAQFEVLKAGMCAWLTGKPLSEIEVALGVAPNRLGVCKRARDLVLKLANRKFYMIAAAISELAKIKLAETGTVSPTPAVLEILAIAIRKGFDTPEKVAFAYIHPELRTRVLAHQDFLRRVGVREPFIGQDFKAVITYVEAILR